jgi:hypothetical protein
VTYTLRQMGINKDGQIAPIPQFDYWYEYIIAIFCSIQFLVFFYHVVVVFRSNSRNTLGYMFRALFGLSLMCTTTQSIHYFTPGHPFLHWFGGTTFSVLMAILVICEMQILKTFTIMTTFITDRKIKFAQIACSLWLLIYLVQAGWLLSILGTSPKEKFLEFIASINYQVYVSFGVLYETWNTIFISYLIVRHRSLPDANNPTTGDKNRLYFHSKNTSLVVHLGFMLSQTKNRKNQLIQ